MPYRVRILVLSALWMQVLPVVAHPAVARVPVWPRGSNRVSNVSNVANAPEDHDYGHDLAYDLTYKFAHGSQHRMTITAEDTEGMEATAAIAAAVIFPPATAGPTIIVTITINNDGSGTATITKTVSSCIATITVDNGLNADTVTVTDTLISSVTECTATTTDITTVTVNRPTTTNIITTASPTVTSTITTRAETVTGPGYTKTKTITETSISAETTTITHIQTETLETTTTVIADDYSNTSGGGGNTIDYGIYSDPYILYKYGLDDRTEYAYTTRNQDNFPFGSSLTIGSPEDLICNRLRSPYNAPQATINLCYKAENATANLSGQEAADM
ncbi:hypothetical protein N7513_008590 [Penicillium frequentans]|nr:hypothetical protein N7513_008590 [Penicillium glabrum]